jgi:IS5 family transposase
MPYFPSRYARDLEEDMGYKKGDKGISFAEGALLRAMEHNRSVEMMERINKAVGWENRAALLQEYYPIGKSHEGADAYPPLMVLKGMVLQKWFHIPSDPELENQINDSIPFKKFLGLPFDKPSPDHAPCSRFRSRLPKDARLVTSVTRAASNDEPTKLKEKRATPEGRRDRKGRPLTFSRDLESDRTVRDDKPHYGLKEHASVDTTNGFILARTMTPASFYESTYLPYCTVVSRHTKDPIETVYADKGYYGRPNRGFLSLNGITDGIMSKDTAGVTVTERERAGNRQLAKKRSIVEQYFGLSHLYDGACRARGSPLSQTISGIPSDRWSLTYSGESKIILAT